MSIMIFGQIRIKPQLNGVVWLFSYFSSVMQ